MSPTRTSIGEIWRATTTSPVPIVGSMLPDITVRLFAWNSVRQSDGEQQAAERAQDDPPEEERVGEACASLVLRLPREARLAGQALRRDVFCTCTVKR